MKEMKEKRSLSTEIFQKSILIALQSVNKNSSHHQCLLTLPICRSLKYLRTMTSPSSFLPLRSSIMIPSGEFIVMANVELLSILLELFVDFSKSDFHRKKKSVLDKIFTKVNCKFSK